MAIQKTAMALVFITGAFLFTIHYKLPAIASLPFLTLGFLLTFFLKEPFKYKKAISMKSYFFQIKTGLKKFYSNYNLKYLALFTFIVGSSIAMMLNLSSKYFELVLIPVALIGLISFLMNLTSAITAKKADYLEQKLGRKSSIILSTTLILIAVLLSALLIPYISVLFFFIIAIVQGFYEVIISDYINQESKTDTRATMLSINNMFSNIGIFLIFPLLGIIQDQISFASSLVFLSILILVALLVLIIKYK